MISFRFLGAGIPRIINEVGNKHRQQQEPSLYSSAAPKGARKPHCSHIDSIALQLLKETANPTVLTSTKYKAMELIQKGGILYFTQASEDRN